MKLVPVYFGGAQCTNFGPTDRKMMLPRSSEESGEAEIISVGFLLSRSWKISLKPLQGD